MTPSPSTSSRRRSPNAARPNGRRSTAASSSPNSRKSSVGSSRPNSRKSNVPRLPRNVLEFIAARVVSPANRAALAVTSKNWHASSRVTAEEQYWGRMQALVRKAVVQYLKLEHSSNKRWKICQKTLGGLSPRLGGIRIYLIAENDPKVKRKEGEEIVWVSGELSDRKGTLAAFEINPKIGGGVHVDITGGPVPSRVYTKAKRLVADVFRSFGFYDLEFEPAYFRGTDWPIRE